MFVVKRRLMLLSAVSRDSGRTEAEQTHSVGRRRLTLNRTEKGKFHSAVFGYGCVGWVTAVNR